MEAEFALSRLRVSREAGDAARAETWHRAWSLAAAAAEAERLQPGAGVRLMRQKTDLPLRPLPQDVPPLAHDRSIPKAVPADGRPSPGAEVDPLDLALERHARIERALQAVGPNPLPDELTEEEWEYHLTAYRVGGPYDCELLQAAEDAVERIVEFRPEFWVEDPEPGESVAPQASGPQLPDCLQIYRESLPDLTEDELRADLETCLAAGRMGTADLIEAELAQHERDTAPEWPTGHPQAVTSVWEGKNPTLGAASESTGAVLVGELPKGQARRAEQPLKRPGTRASQRLAPAPGETPTTGCGYSTVPDWIDTAGRTRTWSLLDPNGAKVAEIATRRDAEKLADLLNRLLPGSGQASPPVPSLPRNTD